MPEQAEVMETVEEELTAAEMVDQAAEQVDEQVDEQEEEVVDDGMQELWEQVAPELAGHVGDLSTEAQVGILLKRLAAQASSEDSTGDTAAKAVADEGAKQGPPQVISLPKLDRRAVQDAATAAFESGNGEALAKMLGDTFDTIGQVVEIIGGGFDEMVEKMNTQSADWQKAVAPSRFRGLLGSVPDAAESDIPAAQRFMDSGDAKTHIAALKLAVFDRLQELKGSTKQAASTKKRGAAGIAANRASGGARAAGQPVTRLPETTQGLRDIMRAEADAEAKRNK